MNMSSEDTARQVLGLLFQFRRTPNQFPVCDVECETCAAPHLSQIVAAVEAKKPIVMVLPAFPGKSPNPRKILSPLPDMGEKLALQFLNTLCRRIQLIHKPGAHIVICSDGRAFSDVIGMHESDVTAYQDEIGRIIAEEGFENLSTFNLDAFVPDRDFSKARRALVEEFGTSIEEIKEKVRAGGKAGCSQEELEAHRLYLGMTRFLVEDSMYPGQTKSRNAVQKECRLRAYELIQKSNAWTEFIAQQFPEAVRLSIHPQSCGSRKLGILLIGRETWITPWHSVAVETHDGFILLKRAEAEALGATLVHNAEGRRSHFQLHAALSQPMQGN